MEEKKAQIANPPDPTVNVRSMINEVTERLDAIRAVEVRRIDEKIDALDVKYQIQFSDSKEAVGTAFIAQEKAIGAALIGTKEAISKSDQVTKEAILKNDTNTDKRFDLLSEKIDGVIETISKSTGQSGLYVTHSDLSVEMEKMRSYFEVTIKPVVTFMNSQTGKEGVTDPMMQQLLIEMKTVNTTLANSGGQQKGISSSWGMVLGVVGLVGSILGIFAIVSRFLP